MVSFHDFSRNHEFVHQQNFAFISSLLRSDRYACGVQKISHIARFERPEIFSILLQKMISIQIKFQSDFFVADPNQLSKLVGKPLRNRYFVVRHGESEANVAGLISSDPAISTKIHGLTHRGFEQGLNFANYHLLAWSS
jgi:hypothetical protein